MLSDCQLFGVLGRLIGSERGYWRSFHNQHIVQPSSDQENASRVWQRLDLLPAVAAGTLGRTRGSATCRGMAPRWACLQTPTSATRHPTTTPATPPTFPQPQLPRQVGTSSTLTADPEDSAHAWSEPQQKQCTQSCELASMCIVARRVPFQSSCCSPRLAL